ncbi:MFS transporter [Burkholderia sp. BCC1977]|uniref:MFS transporter n=1 Tax=Burkholderia sp. BCC1977 TaxID=2817440 RepID=UPI002ABE5E80|nr:MFS transporter [Burkholderia sp. BCC1977]
MQNLNSLQASPTTASDFEATTYRKVAWRLVPFLCLCYLMAYLDRINVGFAKLQMLHDINMDEAAFGLGAGLFFIGYILCEVPSNVMLAKVGGKFWIARIMVTWGILSGLTMFVTQPWQFYTLRILLGAAEAGFLPGVAYFLASWFPSNRRARIMSLFFLGSALSGVIGAPVSGWIMTHMHSTSGLSGWQWLFLIEAIPTVLLGVFTFFVLTNKPEEAQWLNSAERELIASTLAAENQTVSGHRFIDGIKDIKVWIVGGIDFAILICVYAISFWMPTFIRNAGEHDTYNIGLLSAIPSIAAVALLLILGWSSDRSRERRWHIIVPFLLGAAAMVMSTFVTGVAATVALLSIAYGLVFGAIPVLWAVPSTFLRGPAAASGFAVACSVANVAGLISNSLIGTILQMTGSAATAIWAFSFILVLGGGLAFTLPAKLVNR